MKLSDRVVNIFGAATVLLVIVTSAAAHRVDEYLQATTISLEKDRVHAQLRLTPGVEVARTVIATVDTNADGLISQSEEDFYVERVLRELSLTIDGGRSQLRLVSSIFPNITEMKEGTGSILIELDADIPQGSGTRKLIFENHHQPHIAAYLANTLVPSDGNIQITAQQRNYLQSIYEIDYVEARPSDGAQKNSQSEKAPSTVRSGSATFRRWSVPIRGLGIAVLLTMLVSSGLALWWRRNRVPQ
jgi:hypothetical protein